MRKCLPILLFLTWSSCGVSTAVHLPPGLKAEQVAARSRNWIRPFSLPRGGSEVQQSKILRKFTSDARMPSLFAAEEIIFDKYAACLAATEGLRRIRDRDMIDEVKKSNTLSSDPTYREQQITREYTKNSAKVLEAMGLSVKQFNDLGKQISGDERLREKVMEQAYLYRMAATIQMDKYPMIEEDPRINDGMQDYQRDKVQLFCDSMSEIEQLREDQIERLKRALHVDTFPVSLSISDPGLLPFLSPKVRAVVEAFPYQAEDIIKKYGLDSDEFNEMLAETKTNPTFRRKVQKHIKNVGQHAPRRHGQVRR